ncbi:hypothetical protein Taro_031664, partial [Colocasia esculenta]|nr:hypothetical protein [Colocasia esculenta]
MVGNATSCPVAFWEPQAKILVRLSLPLLLAFPSPLRGGEVSFFSGGWSLEVSAAARAEIRAAARSEECGLEVLLGVFMLLLISPCSPPRVVLVVAFVGDHEMWIPSVSVPTDVVTAERVVTSEKASPPSDETLSWHGWPAVCASVGRRPFRRLFPEGVPCVPVPAGLVFGSVGGGATFGGPWRGSERIRDLNIKAGFKQQQERNALGRIEGAERHEEKAGARRNFVLFPTRICNDLHLSPFKIITK